MRERLFIIGSIAVLLAVLAGLNAASYVRIEREPELEAHPDRSTYNAGATGTRALYDYLNESGQHVMRWREPSAALTDLKRRLPDTFVVVGRLRVPYAKDEAEKLRQWVARGGRLVVIDRVPDATLLPPPAADQIIYADADALPNLDVRADNVANLTTDTKPLAPTQPTLLTRDVEQIAPTRFAGRLKLKLIEQIIAAEAHATTNASDDEEEDHAVAEEATEPTPVLPTPQAAQAEDDEATTDEVAESPTPASTPAPAPVFHVTDERGPLLADYRYGSGRVILLSEPFIVTNNGIARADNLQLALNIITAGGGLIAFDEYHQGRAATENQLFAYFAGTPVLALCAQAFVIVLALIWTRGRRFARPLPAPRVDRRSTLEFVASMAELQQRARAYDLAIENVYARTRRALARYGGVAQNVPRTQIAARVAARSGLPQADLETLMRECEDAINGERLSARHALALVRRLRELERTLGIRMRAREIKQAERL